MYLERPITKPKSRKAMITYLAEHFRYNTMNSWNNSTSYGHCIKVDRLGLENELIMSALDMLDVSESFDEFHEVLSEFGRRHDQRWQIAQNGRSSGYLVLIQGGKGKDGRVFTWPGRSLDMYEDFNDWSIGDLKEHVDLIWDFDTTCDMAVATFIDFVKRHTVQEEEILVPRKVRIAVPREMSLGISR